MTEDQSFTAIGLMSGTSLDGMDAAVIQTDGRRVLSLGQSLTRPYEEPFRMRLRAVFNARKDLDGAIAELARDLSLRHIALVRELMAQAGLSHNQVDLIGFHGQTITHDPEKRMTWQIGDGRMLADALGIETVDDFRTADVEAGGQGAPLVPVYHRALAEPLDKPLAVLNLGGVANVTWIGHGEADLLAFDTGPGNALIDDWLRRRQGQPFDEDGRLAAQGRVQTKVLQRLMDHPFFKDPPPKSLDRGSFEPAPLNGLNSADGAATLSAFSAEAVARAASHLPAAPCRWLVSGGGRHNRTLMKMLGDRLDAKVEAVEAVGWDGDALEAQAFGFLAVRSKLGLALTFPRTTGCPHPLPGGRCHLPQRQARPV